MKSEILTPEEMRLAEKAAIRGGLSGRKLMENAGQAAASEIVKRWTKRPVTVLCGPGNNGGDGLVVARLLDRAGWPVGVALAGDRRSLKGDAAAMADLWPLQICGLLAALADGSRLIVDALFGTGLSRPLEGPVAEAVEKLDRLDVPIVAIDIPSGVEGATGKIRGAAVTADVTITFCRKKPAHLLFPGRARCGETIVTDIGISDEIVSATAPRLFENSASLWALPQRAAEGHKFTAGHAVVASGGPWHTGAARLAAQAAQRAGAGLVTIASPTAALDVNAAHLTSILLAEVDTAMALASFLSDRRRNTILLGPALGVGSTTRAKVRAALASGPATVLDADALTSFEETPEELFEAIAEFPQRPAIMTPHAGEFSRLFETSWKSGESKVEQARLAARTSQAIVVYKGPDTVIASPNGTAVINSNAPPWLATAGSGDVLAGIVSGLLAQAMPPLQAAAAAAFIHGEAANRLGADLIAEDLVGQIPAVLQWLNRKQNFIGTNQTALL
ncbi:MAG TPA: NAD(P)H-hydrate dehydratase [Aestuariivirgaceae bacterium]|nr:NAD(P)H-hydrate dehydratase [Aestuariivirgaceae bacterium]